MMSALIDLLPGVYVSVLAVLARRVLGRWFDPLPRRVLAVGLILVVLLLGKALFFGGVLLPLDLLRHSPPFQDLPPSPTPSFVLHGDLLAELAPYQSATRRALAAGEWPLLNPLVGAGEPLLVNSQALHFQPFQILAYPFPMAKALGIVAALRILTALIFTFLFCRRLGLGSVASLAGALAYSLGGFLQFFLGWPLANSAALLPALLYSVTIAVDRGARQDFLLLAGATLGALLGGHPETILYLAAVTGAFAAVRLWGRPRSERLRTAGRIALTLGLTAAVALPVLLPTALYMEKSSRYFFVNLRRESLPPAFENLAQRLGSLEGWKRELAQVEAKTLPVVAPYVFGNQRQGPYWGPTTILQDSSGFAGTVATLAALLAVLGRAARSRSSTLGRFPGELLFAVVGAMALVVVMQPPGLQHLLAAFPVLGHSATYHRRLTLVLNLCTALLAAFTLERWRREGLRRTPVLLVAAGLAIVLAWAYLAHPFPQDPKAYATLRYGSLVLQLFTLAGATGLLLARQRLSRRLAEGLLVLLVAIELSVLFGSANPATPKSQYFPERPDIRFLQENIGHDRMVALGNNFRFNVPVIYGLSDVRSSNPLQPAAFMLVTRPLRANLLSDPFVKQNHARYDLLGVRYVVVKPQILMPLSLRRVFEGNVWIYERPHPLPRLFLPREVQPVDAAKWPNALDGIKDFARLAVVRDSDGKAWKAARPAASSLEIQALETTRIRARARLDENRLLASSVYQDGGWHLLVEGRRAATVTTNVAFVGAWLPAGEHQLDLVYRPPGFLAGCVLAALALALALVVCLFPHARGAQVSPGA